MSHRLDSLRESLDSHNADALLLTAPPDLRWSVGFTGSNGLLVLTPSATHFLTDGRYTAQAAAEVRGAQVHVPGYDLVGHVAQQGLLSGTTRIAIEAERITLAERNRLAEQLPDCEWVPVSGLTRPFRARKDEAEIEAIRRAQALTEDVFDHLIPMIGPGVTERELAAEIVYEHLRRGADAMAFEPIVASGRRGALPHARATDKPLVLGELVVIDMGCMLDGYASDMTRTVALGQPEEGMRKAYEAVLEAQERAIEAVQAGASGRAVDAVARRVLLEVGLADHFTHGLGHGVGLEVHEWPRLSYQVDHTLPENTVVTVEPGVYLPERFGIRIEDLVVAREGGPEVLTKTPKELLIF